MTNTGDNLPTDLTALFPELAGTFDGVAEQGEGYVTVAATLDGHFDHPDKAFRLLKDLRVAEKRVPYVMVNLAKVDATRLEIIGDLVRNGLVEQRNYTAGRRKGRTTLKLTELGNKHYLAAKAAAEVAANAALVHLARFGE